MSATSEVLYDVSERIATITLNRPERMNTISPGLTDGLAERMADAAADPGVRAIILTGAGRAFCAGADMQRLQKSSAGGPRQAPPPTDPKFLKSLNPTGLGPDLGSEFVDRRRFSYFMRVRKPIIAALNGPVAGLGFVMALCADFRFAANDMVFTTSFAQRGLIAEHGISWLLPRLVGPQNALDLLMSARRVAAIEAKQIGLVKDIFPRDELMAQVRNYAKLLAQTVSPRSMAVIKAQVWKSLGQSYSEALASADHELELSMPLPDYKEGVAHYVEKRPANFPDLVASS
jgi:enoyl-CoA hydratase/carnithine racemase